MNKLRFIIVGSGWRSLFYARIARQLPWRFELCAMLCRTEEKAAAIRGQYGIPVSCSEEECAAMKPDFVVVAVNKASLAEVSRRWLSWGFAVLCETPAALNEEELCSLWQLHTQGARLQIAEQYWLYPCLAARLQAVKKGLLGAPAFARLSLAHGYHAVSLARSFLGAGQQQVQISGREWPVQIIETDSRWGRIEQGELVEKTLQRHTLAFEDGAVAFVDFCNVQYHSLLRGTHLNIQGPRGELDDDRVRWLDASGRPVSEQILCHDSVFSLGKEELYRTPFPDADLNEDETAIATVMDRMEAYLAGGPEVYPLADALQDAYLSLLMDQALRQPDQIIRSKKQPWNG